MSRRKIFNVLNSIAQRRYPSKRSVRWTIVTAATVVHTYILLSPHPLWIFGIEPIASTGAVNELVPDKLQHLIAYAVFTALLLYCVPRSRIGGASTLVLLATSHAVATESLQYFVPYRFGDANDFVADSIGIAIGIGAYFAGRRIWRR